MGFKRIYKHLMTAERHVGKILKPSQLDHISNAIKTSETRHSGEIRVAVESSLELKQLMDGQTPRQRAIEVFSELRVWDTELNNGVLIYVLLADKAIEVVADRAIHAKVGANHWEALCRQIEDSFAKGQFEEGVMNCIEAISSLLIEHFPHHRMDQNELPDAPVVIG